MADKVFLGHTTKVAPVTITRPANTTAYAAGDVIGTAVTCELAFADLARSNGGAGMIVNAMVIDSANQATKPTLELWLFTAPLAVVVDNAPFVPTDAEMKTLVGVIDLTTAKVGEPTVGAVGNCVLYSGTVTLPYRCAAATKSLSGYLVVRNAYTPVSAEEFTSILTALQDY